MKLSSTKQNLELMDTKNKMAFVTALGDRGILTDNQILALFGMAPYEGGNTRHISLNYIDAALANTYQMAKAGIGKDPGTNANGTGGNQ